MTRVAVLIPTRCRPSGLAKALDAIGRQQTTAELKIFVADNDAAAREGVKVVETLVAGGYPWSIECFVVPERGTALVRNALFEQALLDEDVKFLALIDDDEWPEARWIEALLEMQDATGADAIGGTMLPAFAGSVPKWASDIWLYRQEQFDGFAAMIWGTCNVLFTRECIEGRRPWFNEQFGLSGGEDTEFFTQLKARGAVFAWSTEARVFEDVPAHRLTLRWVARRAFRIGNSNAFTQMRWRYGTFGPLQIFVKSVGRLVYAASVAFTHLTNKTKIVEAMCLGLRSFGELTALFGVRFYEYG